MKKIFVIFLLCCILFIQNSVYSIDKSDISVTTESKILKSRLKKEYTGFEYTITNESNKKLYMSNVKLVNGVDGNIAYNSIHGGGGKSVGVLWLVCGPVGLFTFGIGWVVGLIGTPIAWIVGNSKDKKARRESIPYTNLIDIGYIQPHESIALMSLVPIGSKGQLKITIQDEKTKEFKTFTY